MASNGYINTGGYDGRYLQFSWSIKSQSIANNSTTISWTLKGAGSTASGYDYYAGSFSVVIDGATVYNYTGERYLLSNGKLVASGEKTIYHNNDGSRNFSASVSGAIYTYAVNATGSGSWALTTIPRQATLTSAPNFNDEESPTINYSNPAGNAVTSIKACISLTGSKDDIAYRDISKTGTCYKFNLTEAERNVLRNACTTANSRNVTFYVTTVIGGVTYYSTLTKTLTIVNANPVITESVLDNGDTSRVLTGNASRMIKGFNYMKASMSASALKGASIKNYSITNGSSTINSSSATFDNTDNNSFVFKVTDSRGNSTTKSITVPMVNYIKLTSNLAADNPTTDGVLNFKVSGNYWSGSFGTVSNTLTVQYRYKIDGGTFSAWTDLSASVSGTTYSASKSISGLDYRTAYVIQARAIDKVYNGGLNTDAKKVKSITVFDWSKNDFNFNVPVSIQGNAINDFVVAQGTSGIWTYRKWNSGVAECWGRTFQTVTTATTSNSKHYTDTFSVATPFTFTGCTSIQLTSGDPWMTVEHGNMSNYNSITWKYESHSAFTGKSYSVGCMIYVMGTWK